MQIMRNASVALLFALAAWTVTTSCKVSPNELLTYMHEAKQDVALAQIRSLVRRGAKVSVQDQGGYTPLFFSARYGEVNVTMYLLAIGARVNQQNRDGLTALHIATHFGTLRHAQALLAGGAQVNAATKSGQTPLMSAAISRKSSIAMLKLLIAYGARPDDKNKQGQTAYDQALVAERPAIANFLQGIARRPEPRRQPAKN